MIFALFLVTIGLAEVYFVAQWYTQSQRRQRGGESNWDHFTRVSGHRFDAAPGDDKYCTRCGTALAFWEGRMAELVRSKCHGPYREPLWLRVARRIVADGKR